MAIPVQEVHRGAFSSLEAARPAPHGSVAGALLPSLSIAISALILAAEGAPLSRRSAARSRGREAPRADRGGRTRRRHLLWPAAVAGGCCVCRCRSGSPSLFRPAGSRVGRWSSTGRCPPATSRRARAFGEDIRAPLHAYCVGRVVGCKGKSWPCVLAAAGTAVADRRHQRTARWVVRGQRRRPGAGGTWSGPRGCRDTSSPQPQRSRRHQGITMTVAAATCTKQQHRTLGVGAGHQGCGGWKGGSGGSRRGTEAARSAIKYGPAAAR